MPLDPELDDGVAPDFDADEVLAEERGGEGEAGVDVRHGEAEFYVACCE